MKKKVGKRVARDTVKLPKAPETHTVFVQRFPELGKAWDLIHRGGDDAGGLDARTCRLVRLAIAVGARQQGAVHSSARKALAMGIPMDELEQVVALAAGTIGLPATVAAYTWVHDESAKRK